MKKNLFLQDVILGDSYIKVVTDSGSFCCKTTAEDEKDLSFKFLKLIGKNIEMIFESSDQAYNGEFSTIELIKTQEKPVLIPRGKVYKRQISQKIYGPPGTGKTTKLIDIVKAVI